MSEWLDPPAARGPKGRGRVVGCGVGDDAEALVEPKRTGAGSR